MAIGHRQHSDTAHCGFCRGVTATWSLQWPLTRTPPGRRRRPRRSRRLRGWAWADGPTRTIRRSCGNADVLGGMEWSGGLKQRVLGRASGQRAEM